MKEEWEIVVDMHATYDPKERCEYVDLVLPDGTWIGEMLMAHIPEKVRPQQGDKSRVSLWVQP